MDVVGLTQRVIVPSGLVSLVINWGLGVFVFSRNPRSPLHRFFAIFALSVGGWSVGSSLVNLIADETLALRVLRACYVAAAFVPTFFLHFTFVLTEQQALQRRWLGPAYATSGIFAALVPTELMIRRLRVMEPYGFRITDPGVAYPAFVLFFTVGLAAGLRLIYARMRATPATAAAGGDARRQLQYILAALLIAMAAGLEYFSRVFGLVRFPPIDDYILVVYFLVFAYAVVRHRLLDIHVVISRSLVYSLLIAAITAAYLVMVLIMEKWFQGFFGYRSLVATTIVAFLIAVFFNPLRSRLQTVVDRALFHATPAELAAQRERLLAEVRKGQQQQAVAALAAGLAHEIKNPLAAIKIFVEYLPERHGDPEFLAKFHRIVGGEVEKIRRIVQDLLSFAKPDAFRREEVTLHELIDETLTLLGGDCVKRQVKIETSVEPSLRIIGDRTRLKQVLLNLYLNSLEAMEPGGTLRIEGRQQDGQVIVSVTDTGCGIASRDLPRVFDPFFTTKSTGTGLGLSVIQGIIKDHDGEIAIRSQPGHGTTVRIQFPAAPLNA